MSALEPHSPRSADGPDGSSSSRDFREGESGGGGPEPAEEGGQGRRPKKSRDLDKFPGSKERSAIKPSKRDRRESKKAAKAAKAAKTASRKAKGGSFGPAEKRMLLKAGAREAKAKAAAKRAIGEAQEPKAPKVGPEVKKLLDKIGVPDPRPFSPDPFQLKAAELIKGHDVIVSAPTGSGKTWIAKQAIAFEMERGRRSWYASPLKALSNSKFLELGKDFGQEKVGLLTGDHKINTKAPVLVGTTEILRNQLYDSMGGYGELEVDLVVLDEAHYIGDDERGVVWEEILIYMPSRVRFLLLSATIDNAGELAAWLSAGRGRPVKVVSGGQRPVPLEPLCLDSGQLTSIYRTKDEAPGKGRLRGGHRQPRPAPPESRLGELAALNLLPAIFFLKSRRDCDTAVLMAKRPPDTPERMKERARLIDEYVSAHPYLASYPATKSLVKSAMASHHAGHLPQFKMLVEELMSRNLLSAIFATSTVAAGVNFPARTVVIPQSDRFNGEEFVPLTATELAQMTGRAGRRGLDLIGFAVVLKGPYQDLKLMAGLFNSPPDPVRSALKINFSMALNLLRSYEIESIPELLSRSLAAWQSAGPRHTRHSLKRASQAMLLSFNRHVAFLKETGLVSPEDSRLTEDGLLAAALRIQHPLVLYQAAASGGLPDSPESLAAAMTILGGDRRAALEGFEIRSLLRKEPKLSKDLKAMLASVKPMADALRSRGFEAPPDPDLRLALAVHEWASSHDYQKAASLLGLGAGWPGDLVRQVMLAGEHLNQLANLEDQRTEKISKVAREARRLIMVEPMI
ncbi:MAG: DEAD/DEAH box helicase [Deltaproteobacteria bacterium]|jgi:superfamily II RNA helicase|nr:DEAD/DEAH box helicase [Deltaproteobacteria bacterium]